MPDHPIIFWELASHDAERSAEFLRRVFGWDIQYDRPSNFYDVAASMAPGPTAGGEFTLRRAKLPFLTLYIQVDDIVAKAREVEEAGGFVFEPPHEIPGGSWICLFNEPSGVPLAIIQRPKQQ